MSNDIEGKAVVMTGASSGLGEAAARLELKKLTPNLVVADVDRSLTFYRDFLGFSTGATVPDVAPYVFASVQSGPVEIFLNASEPAIAEYPAFRDRPIGGTLTLFLEVSGVRQAYDSLKEHVKIVMPLEKKWYGVTEFAFEDRLKIPMDI